MSTNYTAKLFFGVKLPDKYVDDDDFDGLPILRIGNGFSGDIECYIVHPKAGQSFDGYGASPIDCNKIFSVNPKIEDRLRAAGFGKPAWHLGIDIW